MENQQLQSEPKGELGVGVYHQVVVVADGASRPKGGERANDNGGDDEMTSTTV